MKLVTAPWQFLQSFGDLSRESERHIERNVLEVLTAF